MNQIKTILFALGLLTGSLLHATNDDASLKASLQNPFNRRGNMDCFYWNGKKFILTESPMSQVKEPEKAMNLYGKEYYFTGKAIPPFFQDKFYECSWSLVDSTLVLSDIQIPAKRLRGTSGRPSREEVALLEEVTQSKMTTRWNEPLALQQSQSNPMGVIPATWVDSIDVRALELYQSGSLYGHYELSLENELATPYYRLYFDDQAHLVSAKEIRPTLPIIDGFGEGSGEHLYVTYQGKGFDCPVNPLKEAIGEDRYNELLGDFTCSWGIVEGLFVLYGIYQPQMSDGAKEAAHQVSQPADPSVYEQLAACLGTKFTRKYNPQLREALGIDEDHIAFQQGILPIKSVKQLDLKSGQWSSDLFDQKISYCDYLTAPYQRLYFKRGKLTNQKTITPRLPERTLSSTK